MSFIGFSRDLNRLILTSCLLSLYDGRKKKLVDCAIYQYLKRSGLGELLLLKVNEPSGVLSRKERVDLECCFLKLIRAICCFR